MSRPIPQALGEQIDYFESCVARWGSGAGGPGVSSAQVAELAALVAETVRAAALLRELGTPCLIHQPRYSLFDRQPEQGLFATLEREQIGAAVFSPLAKGLPPSGV